MQRFLFALLIAVFALGAFPVNAAASPSSPLCLPGTYAASAEDCLPFGPSAYLSQMQDLGITFPLQTLPSSEPDGNLSYLPYAYGRVLAQPAPIFSSIEEAQVGKIAKRYIEAGFDFISYLEVREFEGKQYVLIAPGEWMRRGDLSLGAAYALFMGLEFETTPERDFGWMLQAVQISSAPGEEPAFSATWLARWDVIQVYDRQEAAGLTWYLIGPNQWIDSRTASLVYPDNEAPNGVENGRWIEINLHEQSLSVYENNELIYATLISSGVPGFWTRPGLFQIQEKLETTPMTGAFEADRSDYYYLEDVPWTMYFDEARALHGAYWHTKFGYEQSHGCVNLSSGDSQWLYHWASPGDWVYVWDPSGETPTDPSLYGSGGA